MAKWKLVSYSPKELIFSNDHKCKIRPTSKRERALILKQFKDDRKVGGIHKSWHRFVAKFKTDDDKWKLRGYKFSKAVERHAKLDPNVEVFHCDDGAFAGSDIVLVHHQCDYEYWGTRVITIPQTYGDIGEVFLYPQHTKELLACLQRILRIYKSKLPKKRKRNKEWKLKFSLRRPL